MPMNNRLRWYSVRWPTVVICAIILGVGYYYLKGRFYHPVGSGPAGPAVEINSFSNTWSSRRTLLIGLGDSITEGFGASKKHNYFELLIANDDGRYSDMKGRDLRSVFEDLECRNYAGSFVVTEEVLRDQIPKTGTFPSDFMGIVVMTTGGNDIILDYGRSKPRDGAMYGCTYEEALVWGENFRKRLRKIVDGILSKFPGGCQIFIANIYDPTDGVGDIENASLVLHAWPDGLRALALFNRIIAQECDLHQNVHLVDIHSHFLGHGIHCRDKQNKYYRKEDPYYWYHHAVLEDPNDRGYDAIRRIFLLKMIEVFTNEDTAFNKFYLGTSLIRG